MSENLGTSREAWIRGLVSRVTLARGYKSALGGVLKRLCRSGDWSYAEAWIPTHDGKGLKMGPVFARGRSEEVSSFRQRGREIGFRPGQGLAGQVLETAMPRWVASLAAGGNELPRRQALAKDAGFLSAAAFPILVNDRQPGGLFYLGMYGGKEQEGVWPEDDHEPKRFFCFHTDDQICAAVSPFFRLESFQQVPLEADEEFHFQSLILRRL